MDHSKHWYLVSYDLRDPKRWRKVYERVKGNAERVQYSVFKMYISQTQLERFRLDMAKLMDDEDDLLIIRLCSGCAKRVIDTSTDKSWDETRPPFEIL